MDEINSRMISFNYQDMVEYLQVNKNSCTQVWFTQTRVILLRDIVSPISIKKGCVDFKDYKLYGHSSDVCLEFIETLNVNVFLKWFRLWRSHVTFHLTILWFFVTILLYLIDRFYELEGVVSYWTRIKRTSNKHMEKETDLPSVFADHLSFLFVFYSFSYQKYSCHCFLQTKIFYICLQISVSFLSYLVPGPQASSFTRARLLTSTGYAIHT